MKKRIFVILAALTLILAACSFAAADGEMPTGCEAWLAAAREEASKANYIVGTEDGIDNKNGVTIIMPGETIAVVPQTGVAQAGIQGGISSQTIVVTQFNDPVVNTDYLKTSKPEKTTFTELEKRKVPFFYGDRIKDSVDYTEGPTYVEYVSLYRNDTGLPVVLRGTHGASRTYMTTKTTDTVAGIGRHGGKNGAVNFQTWHNFNYAPIFWFAEPYYEIKLWEKTSGGKKYEWRTDDYQTTYKVYVSHEDQTFEIDNPMVEEWFFQNWDENKLPDSAFPIKDDGKTEGNKTKFTWNMQAQMYKNRDMSPQYFLADHELGGVFLIEGRTIRFDANGGTINGKKTLLVESGHDDVYTVSPKDYVPVREGHKFLGWCTDEDEEEETLLENPTAENSKEWFKGKHMTLYAAWEEIDKVEAFVTRCYTLILGRDPDKGGLEGWCDALEDKKAAAANIIDGFVKSDEFTNRKLSAEAKVDILYKTMLDRAADEGGKAGWVDALNKGYTLQHIINGFCKSDEFTALCKDFDIEPGTVNVDPVTPEPAPDTPRGKIEAFVKRCYQLILNRAADDGGLKGWSDALEGKTAAAAQIIDGFVRSPEYINRSLTSDQSVTILYKTMLDRDPDEAGKAGWVDALSKGYTLQHIINGFCGSAEFTKICSDYGIQAGSVAVPARSAAILEAAAQLEAKKLPDERIGNAVSADDAGITVVNGYEPAEVEAFVKHAYRAALGREADEAGLAGWTEQIVSGAVAPKAFLRTLLFSDEQIARKLNNEQFIEMLYRLYLNRGTDDAAADRVAQLAAGGLDEVIKGFEGSAEFRLVLNGFGL